MPLQISVTRCRRVPAPVAGFYRVSAWHDPFDPPPPPLPIEDDAIDDERAGRWDDPDGLLRTLYCASTAEGAIGEKLADFVLNIAAAVHVETFFVDEPDGEFVEDPVIRPLDRADVESFGWQLAHADSNTGMKFLDVNHWTTHVATAPAAAGLVAKFGIRALDRRALLDERRNFTRRLAGVWRAAATPLIGDRAIAGLRYRSRLPPAWICWALWDPLPIVIDSVTAEPVTIGHAALRSAARKLGVLLAE
jgi:hypothetical protein